MARPRSDALCESVFSSVGPAMAGLQIKNSFGDHATDNQITQSEDVAPQPGSTVNIRFWPYRADDVHRHIAGDVTDGAPERISPVLAEQ